MAVIPNDSTGRVIVWDANGMNQGIPLTQRWPQRFSVGNPETQGLPGLPGSFVNYEVLLDPGSGDLFCSGHVWLPDGRLFVAGGNTMYPVQGVGHFEGSRFAGIWNPAFVGNAPNHGWTFLALMTRKRWYPTVTLIIDTLGRPRVMVSGGVESTANEPCNGIPDAAFDTYEVWDIGGFRWERDLNQTPPLLEYIGPTHASSPCWTALGEYPRIHLVSTNHAFVSGMFAGSNRVRHVDTSGPTPTPQNWLATPLENGNFRNYGSSVLLPNVGNTTLGRDLIMILGGYAKYNGGGPGNTLSFDTCKIIDGGATTFPVNPNAWTLSPHVMLFGRMCANAVLLPNGEVLAVGGCHNNYFQQATTPVPVWTTEAFNKATGWRFEGVQSSPRMYHSTAVLLPSGRVVSAGGDYPYRASDWEVFTPSYMSQGLAQPVFAGAWGNPGSMTLSWGTDYIVEHAPLAAGVGI